MSDLTPAPILWGYGLRYYQTPSINEEEAKAEISFIVLFIVLCFQQPANKINIISTTDSSDCKKKEEK